MAVMGAWNKAVPKQGHRFAKQTPRGRGRFIYFLWRKANQKYFNTYTYITILVYNKIIQQNC